ncbi:MAG: SDR family oxidoreductase [Candidatus Atribacteria bacterium]|nr:SDR family oxidoreductase [Candidatus Atribacteria bacterium]
MKRALITGAAGFIGSHLCERFIQEGYFVFGLDNFLTGNPANIALLLENPNFHFMEYNVTNYLFVSQELDLILHFACPASPVDYLKYPIQTMKVDSLGTLHALGLAKLKRARFILASTSEVYGDPGIHPQPESYWGNVNPIGVRSVYDEAKRFSEALTMAYFREHHLDTRIARIFNTYGPRMRAKDGRVVPNFIMQALKGEPLTIYGDGSQTRSFCFIHDLVEGIFRLSTHEELNGQIFNLGNPDEHEIRDFAHIILNLTHSSSSISFHPLPPDDPKRRKPDITLAKTILGWEPKISLPDGLLQTIGWFQSKNMGGSTS